MILPLQHCYPDTHAYHSDTFSLVSMLCLDTVKSCSLSFRVEKECLLRGTNHGGPSDRADQPKGRRGSRVGLCGWPP